MKSIKIKMLAIVGILLFSITGCQNAQETVTNQADQEEVITTSEVSSTWDENATQITLNETSINIDGTGASESDGVITISAAGTYVISGILEDGQIQIDADEEDSVQIVLNGVDITCSDSAVIDAKEAKEVILTVATGTENILTDADTYVYEDETKTNLDAAVFAKTKLYINGSGMLTVNGNYNHAMVSKDAMYIDDATILLTAVEDGINAKDAFTITSGILTITAGDDGIHTDAALTVNGGTITINESEEGLEGSSIEINNGEIAITANDDGMNAANSDETEVSHNITINGGTILVDAMGDGLDANGSIVMTGGEVTVLGPVSDGDGSLDYDGTFTISGGTLIAAGSSGMVQGVDDSSTQNALLVIFDQKKEAGTAFEIVSADGTSIVSITPEKTYQSVLVSTSALAQNTEYTVKYNGEELTSVILNQAMTSISEDGSEVQLKTMGEFGGPGGGMPGGEPPVDGEMPEGGARRGEAGGGKPAEMPQNIDTAQDN